MGNKPLKEDNRQVSNKLRSTSGSLINPCYHDQEEKNEPIKFQITLEKIKCKNLTHVTLL